MQNALIQSDHLIPTILLGAFLVYLVPKFFEWRARKAKLDAIPTMGESGFFSSYLSALKYRANARKFIEEGYKKYPGKAFKIPRLDRWYIVVSGHALIEDMKRAPEEKLSLKHATAETFQTEFTLGKRITEDQYHVGIIRTSLTRSIASRFPEVQDEIAASFSDEIPLTEDWIKVRALDTIMKIVCRTSNRLFVGLPLCRSPEYRDLNIQFTIDAFIDARKINRFPKFLKPLVGRLITKVPASVKLCTKFIEPIVKERLAKEKEYGTKDWPEKPNDLISWLLDEAEEGGPRREMSELATRVLLLNLGAIHTTSNTFTHALFHLAAHPELAKPLREEAESAIEELGWSKAAMGRMNKIDSFLKECQRERGVQSVTMERMAMEDFTFSDGTVIPKGAVITVASYAIHHDNQIYQEPDEVDPFRFSNMRDGTEEGANRKHHMVTVTSDYLLFGNGKNVCPGRFFAVNELKALLCHVLINYDVKLEQEGVVPEAEFFEEVVSPNRMAEVMFRRRRAG